MKHQSPVSVDAMVYDDDNFHYYWIASHNDRHTSNHLSATLLSINCRDTFSIMQKNYYFETYTIASTSDDSFGDVHPKISPGESGLHWGTVTRNSDKSSLLWTDCAYSTTVQHSQHSVGKCFNSKSNMPVKWWKKVTSLSRKLYISKLCTKRLKVKHFTGLIFMTLKDLRTISPPHITTTTTPCLKKSSHL